MKYLLDSNICIYIINGKHPEIRKKFYTLQHEDVFLSAVSYAELYLGIEKSMARDKSLAKLLKFAAPFEILPFDEKCVPFYAMVRAYLESLGQGFGALDLLIAAQALAYDLILVTRDMDFDSIPNLRVESWDEE